MVLFKSFIKVLCVFACWSWAGQVRAQSLQSSQHIYLGVGQSKVVLTSGQAQIHLSRRGIVDVFEISKKELQITALQSGHVAITLTDLRTEDILQKIFVHTKKVNKQKQQTQGLWFCRHRSIECDGELNMPFGETNDLPLYLAAYSTCKKKPDCVWNLRLGEIGRQIWRERVAALVSPVGDFVVNPLAQVVVEKTCDAKQGLASQKQLNDQLQQFGYPPLVVVRCNLQANITIHARVLASDRGSASQLGFKPDLKTSFKGLALELRSNPELKLVDVLKDQDLKVLVEPTMHTQPGQAVEFKTGGKFRLDHPTKDKQRQSFWTNHGVTLSMTPKQVGSDAYLLSYELILNNRVNLSSTQDLHSNKLKGTMVLPLQEDVLLGEITYKSDASARSGSSMMQSIPIIGPLFRTYSQSATLTTVGLWVRLEVDLLRK